MRSSLGWLPGLFRSSLTTVAWVVGGLGILAVLFGRSSPDRGQEPAADRASRTPAYPRYVDVGGGWPLEALGDPPQLLDTETGDPAPCPSAGLRYITPLGCSPWRDGAGQYHLVGC